MSSDLLTTLLWLASPAAIGGIIVWLLANWPWFANLEPTPQKLVKFGIAIALTLASLAVTTLVPAETISKLQPVWAAIYAAISAVLGMEVTNGALIRFQFWQEQQFVSLMQSAGLLVTGAMLVERFLKHGSKTFRTLVANAVYVDTGNTGVDRSPSFRG